MKSNYNHEFKIGQRIWLVSDPEQHERMVTAIIITPNGITYKVTCGAEETEHYELEISDSKKVI